MDGQAWRFVLITLAHDVSFGIGDLDGVFDISEFGLGFLLCGLRYDFLRFFSTQSIMCLCSCRR